MLIDKLNEFANGTALDTTGADTDLIGDVIDLGANTEDIGNGEPLYLVIRVATSVTSAGAAAVQFQLASDAQAAIATDGSATVHWQSGAIGKATLVAGYTMIAPIPPGTYERYLGILTVTGTAALTAGAIDAFITKDYQKWTSYPDALTV